MALDLEEQDGQTPLDPDEKAGLKAGHLTTQAQLNDWEQTNILKAVRWLQRTRDPEVLSEGFCRDLHKQMFKDTWKWAGTFRRSDKNIGCDWTQVAVKLKNLFENTRWWIDNKTFPPDEIAARFHRDLVWIHPFPNGNGRHARMASRWPACSRCSRRWTCWIRPTSFSVWKKTRPSLSTDGSICRNREGGVGDGHA